MFEDNHMDKDRLLLGSILENGQEEVPDRVWMGVAQGLDRLARHRRFMRAGVLVSAVAAVAAAVAIGVVLWNDSQIDIVPAAEGQMIAVVKNEATGAEKAAVMIAQADERHVTHAMPAATDRETIGETVPQHDSGKTKTEGPVQEKIEAAVQEVHADSRKTEEVDDGKDVTIGTSWIEEDERETRHSRIRTSVVLSGIAGTNNPQRKSGSGQLRRPGMLKTPSRTTVEQVSEDVTYGIPVSFGAGIRVHFTKYWSLGVGLNYTLMTSKFNGKYTKVESGRESVPVSGYVHNTQHYIGIPVNAYYNIISQDFINFYAYAGGAVERCIGNVYQMQTTPVINHREKTKGVQLSANAGIGVEFMLGRHTGVYLDPSLRYYFRCGQPKSIRTAQPLMLGFEFGFRFTI